jgi:lysyl-tRNA synthetase class 2
MNTTSMQTSSDETEILDQNEQIKQRKEKLAHLRQTGQAYPNDFTRSVLAKVLHDEYDAFEPEILTEKKIIAKMAGRMMTRRIMGKASFVTIQDMSGQIQLYLSKNELPEEIYENFKSWDLGDILGVEGEVFKTKTGELTIKVSELRLLTKALRPLPDKFHGLQDHEQRFRQRYLDLLVNEQTRRIFEARSKIVSEMRHFLNDRGYLEVETPMMHSLAGGAAARPFMTHHNALDMDLFLRIAPELYLKRLVVGGLEKVYEINRNFRNEGLSTRHNPEFTMLEFYQAYATYVDMMNITEEMFRYLAENVFGQTQISYQGQMIDYSQAFRRMTLKESIMHYHPEITENQLNDLEQAKQLLKQYKITYNPLMSLGAVQLELFENLVEEKLIQPTFITAYPTEVSPLARKNDQDPFYADRFEFFAGGREIANGFSELNDPEDQAERFREQLKAREAGSDEAMSFDEDYITALEHGLPPTAGEGIGIDRLVMLFTDSTSIRDVILFPLMRPKSE